MVLPPKVWEQRLKTVTKEAIKKEKETGKPLTRVEARRYISPAPPKKKPPAPPVEEKKPIDEKPVEPEETETEYLLKYTTPEEAKRLGFFLRTPQMPGTKLREELESQKRIFCNNWDYYDMQHTVFFPKKMTPYELQEGLISAYENYYSTRNVIHHLKKFKMFQSIDMFYTKKLFNWGLKQNRSYLDYLHDISKKS